MTDDKGAGEGPYGHRCYMQIDPDGCVACSWSDGHARGIREERERFFKALDGLLEDNGGLTTYECLQVMRDALGGQNAK